jgi:hypothetical protein
MRSWLWRFQRPARPLKPAVLARRSPHRRFAPPALHQDSDPQGWGARACAAPCHRRLHGLSCSLRSRVNFDCHFAALPCVARPREHLHWGAPLSLASRCVPCASPPSGASSSAASSPRRFADAGPSVQGEWRVRFEPLHRFFTRIHALRWRPPLRRRWGAAARRVYSIPKDGMRQQADPSSPRPRSRESRDGAGRPVRPSCGPGFEFPPHQAPASSVSGPDRGPTASRQLPPQPLWHMPHLPGPIQSTSASQAPAHPGVALKGGCCWRSAVAPWATKAQPANH